MSYIVFTATQAGSLGSSALNSVNPGGTLEGLTHIMNAEASIDASSIHSSMVAAGHAGAAIGTALTTGGAIAGGGFVDIGHGIATAASGIASALAGLH